MSFLVHPDKNIEARERAQNAFEGTGNNFLFAVLKYIWYSHYIQIMIKRYIWYSHYIRNKNIEASDIAQNGTVVKRK